MTKTCKINDIDIGGGAPLTIIAGPCVIEDAGSSRDIAAFLQALTQELDLPFFFKASFDKANRTSIHSYRGPGVSEGLGILKGIKEELGVKILSDVHDATQMGPASEVLDVIQIPAFLCRQTDILIAAGQTGKPINIKKGQFLAPWDMMPVVEKIKSTGNANVMITERGATFGYNNLVVDFRGISIMQSTAGPVIFDATHSVQLPGGQGQSSGGQREFAPQLAKAAVAAGTDGIFLEVHPEPDKALCDGPNSLPLKDVKGLLVQLKAIQKASQNGE